MTYGASAYQQAARTVEAPRDREAALLSRAAASLQRVQEEWPNNFDQLESALTFNRKLWTVFMTSATREENPLPVALRQNITNLGMFVMNETREMLLEPRPQRLGALINLNRQLADGLRNRAA